MNTRLANKHVVITGAGSGLGRSSALRMAEEGAKVAVVDLNLNAARQVVDDIEAAGGSAYAYEADVTNESSMKQLTESVLADLEHVDVVFANAGIPGNGDAATTSMETWNQVIGVNLTGVWLSSKFFLPHMIERGEGSIINQASLGGLVGLAGIFPYAAAKGGVITMTKQMAIEYGPNNIRVNAIAPGTIPTPLVRESRRALYGYDMEESEANDIAKARFPLRRLGKPEDIANMAVFLASDEANWVSGAVFSVDGARAAQ